MDATLEDRSPTRWTARPGSVFIVETLALFAVLAAPYFILDYVSGVIVNAVIALGYIIWPPLASWRKRRSATEPVAEPKKTPVRVFLLVFWILFSVVLIATGVTVAIFAGWMTWVYRIEFLPASIARAMWAVSVIFVLAPVLFLALVRPRGKGTPVNDFLHALRARGLAPFREAWLAGGAQTIAIICFLSAAAGILATNLLVESMNAGVAPAAWELALVFPFIPLGLIATAAMLSIYRMIGCDRTSIVALARTYGEEPADAPAPASRTGAFGGFAVTCAWVAMLYVTLYPIHLGLVAALSSVAGIAPAFATTEAIEVWVEEQRAEGKTGAELAAILNEHGRWSADSPNSGLSELFPDLKDSLPTTEISGLASCSITLAAGVADPAAVSGVDWLEPEQAGSDLRYCVRTACPNPVAWKSPDSVMLNSSHFSQNKLWTGNVFIDVFARGRAPGPGGYCTANGRLADEFQG